MVLGRELLPKFSIVTKIFSIFFNGIPAFAPSALAMVMGLGRLYFSGSNNAKDYAPSALAFEI